MTNEKKLVIVESPSKAKTIGKYLGSDYQVKACMGHLRDLPKSTLGVDIEHNFKPEYLPLENKKDIIADLKKSASKADSVYLATDPDREGEAIAWHLKTLLKLSDAQAQRVTFNEITRNVVTDSIAHPRSIDLQLVDAQQARRVLDRIVGYQLSPLLWKKIRKGLSAGRVQSVATRLVVDRENEIRAFVPQEYWSLDVVLQRYEGAGEVTAQFYGDPKKRTLVTESDTLAVKNDIEGKDFTVSSVKRSTKKRSPAPPFITSTLQQEASRKLNMSTKRTMMIAQQLYEGVEIAGEGTIGMITYMRTDSLRLSEEALTAAGALIRERYGDSFYTGSPRRYKSKSGAQDAHEAIRPSNVYLTPERVQTSLTKDQYRLYKLIWDRFVASQMENASYDVVTAELTCGKNAFRANHQVLKFAGFTAIYEEGRDDEADPQTSAIPDIHEGELLRYASSDMAQHFTQPPARYTEATLVKAMEENGVGRPSTYATIVSTIQDKEYVVKKDKHLIPTPLGEVVNGLMHDRFEDIINVEFTAKMEEQLDMVEAGKLPWQEVLRNFYVGFHRSMVAAEEALKDTRIKVPDEVSDEICELCGRQMVIKVGRFGKFLACPGFPECKNTKPIVEVMPGRCPKCGSTILKRKSKKGYAFYACERGSECGFMTWDVPTAEDCPLCGNTLFKKSGRGRQRTFCINPDCKNFLPEDQRGYRKTASAGEAKKATKKAGDRKVKSK